MHAHDSGVDPGFYERGSEYRGVSLMQSSGGHGPPEATGFFVIILKSYLMQDLAIEHNLFKKGFNQIRSRGCGGRNPSEDISCFII